VDIVRERLHEAVHLVDELRNERKPDPDDDRCHDEVRDADRRASAETTVLLNPGDERVQCQREEERDDEPRDDVA
jgi:hypothetical protein